MLKLPVKALVKLPPPVPLVKLLLLLLPLDDERPLLESGRMAMAASLEVTFRALPAALYLWVLAPGCCVRALSAVDSARCLPMSSTATASSVTRWAGSMEVMERMVSMTGVETCSGNASRCDFRNSAKNGHASVVERKGE